MNDDKISGEGPKAPNEQKPMRRRRVPKLSGPVREAVGELAYALHRVSRADMPDAQRWQMLDRVVAEWAARYL